MFVLCLEIPFLITKKLKLSVPRPRDVELHMFFIKEMDVDE